MGVSEPAWPISSRDRKIVSLGSLPPFKDSQVVVRSCGLGWGREPRTLSALRGSEEKVSHRPLTHRVAWRQRSVTTILTGCPGRESVGLELEACRISKKAAEVGECKPQTTSSQPHKQDGVLTGSPFPKVIEEESLGGQRRLNFLYLLPSEFATNLTSRELFPRVPPLQRRPVRIRRLRDLDTCSYKHRELSVPDAASATLHCVPSFCRPRELGGPAVGNVLSLLHCICSSLYSSQGESDTKIINFPRLLRLTEVLHLSRVIQMLLGETGHNWAPWTGRWLLEA